jgi:hypothetical protein
MRRRPMRTKVRNFMLEILLLLEASVLRLIGELESLKF